MEADSYRDSIEETTRLSLTLADFLSTEDLISLETEIELNSFPPLSSWRFLHDCIVQDYGEVRRIAGLNEDSLGSDIWNPNIQRYSKALSYHHSFKRDHNGWLEIGDVLSAYSPMKFA